MSCVVDPPSIAPSMRKTLLAGMMGNVMEWYDFGLYGYFAPIIATLFFPSSDPLVSLMSTFGVFAAGFLMRPIGAAVFGHFGDRYGRKSALTASVILMAVPTGLIGLLPTHAEAGVTAVVLLTVLRLLQGLSVGGEYTGSITFLVEHAAPAQRGFIGSWSGFSAVLGILLGSGVGALLTSLVDRATLEAWAWRVPFLLGVLIGFVGLYMRMGIEETPNFKKLKNAGDVARFPLAEALLHYRRELLMVIGLLWLQSVAFYMIFVYMTTYLKEAVKLPLHDALTINTLSMALLCLLTPFMGWLSDRFGRRPQQLLAAAGFLGLSYPLFVMLTWGDYYYCLLAQCIFAVMMSALLGPMPTLLVEIFATRARYTALSLGYNVALAAFGGGTPLVATYLIDRTGNIRSPAIYLTLSAAVTLGVLWHLRETYREPLR